MKLTKSTTIVGATSLVVLACSSYVAVAGIDAGGTPSKKTGSADPIVNFPSGKVVNVTGPISIAQPLTVNGIRFDTSRAIVVVDGRVASAAALATGQVVTVRGALHRTGTTGIAEYVYYDDLAEGPIETVEPGTGTFTVLGQTVLISDMTTFSEGLDALALSELGAGQIVEISGYRDPDGRIVATRVAASNASSDFDLTGTVRWVDAARFRLAVNGLVVDYSRSNLYGLPMGEPEVGMRIEIRSLNRAGDGRWAAGALIANPGQLVYDAGSGHGDRMDEDAMRADPDSATFVR